MYTFVFYFCKKKNSITELYKHKQTEKMAPYLNINYSYHCFCCIGRNLIDFTSKVAHKNVKSNYYMTV